MVVPGDPIRIGSHSPRGRERDQHQLAPGEPDDRSHRPEQEARRLRGPAARPRTRRQPYAAGPLGLQYGTNLKLNSKFETSSKKMSNFNFDDIGKFAICGKCFDEN